LTAAIRRRRAPLLSAVRTMAERSTVGAAESGSRSVPCAPDAM